MKKNLKKVVKKISELWFIW